MAKSKKPSMSPLRKEFLRAQTRIKRLGYEAPATPQRVTKKALAAIQQQEQTVIESHKAYRRAKQRQRYYQKRGFDVQGIQIDKGKSAEEYAQFTGSYFTSYSQEQAKSRHPESIQPYENRYQSTIDIIINLDNEIASMAGMTAWSKNYQNLADRKSRIISVVKDYWNDIVDTSDYESLVKLAASIEGKAETLQELITKRLYDSKSTEAQDVAVLAQIIEILTGAKLSRFDQAIINDELDSDMFEVYD